MKRKSMFVLAMVGCLAVFATAGAAEKREKKIVFLWSEGHHPNREGCRLFKHCLENSPNIKGIKCEIYNTWPEDPSVLEEAAAIVIYSEGINEEMKRQGKPHPVFNSQERLEYLDALMKKGVGLVCVHYTLYATRELEAPKLLDWIGAYYDFQGHGSDHFISQKPQVCTAVTAEHPISRGWNEFTLEENEIYHNFRFAENPRLVPILAASFEDKKTNETKRHFVAWAIERKDGGRGFGLGGGHFYNIWLNDSCRKMMLNAILWTAKVAVPEDGVKSFVPDHLKAERQNRHSQANESVVGPDQRHLQLLRPDELLLFSPGG